MQPPTFENDESVMRRALDLARCGLGYVEPNPPVGAVIVDDSLRLLGEGFHERFGAAHAEVNALDAAGDRADDATMFVTLEPCCHRGKTGPCTEAVIAAGVKRVVIGSVDPNPEVAGNGIEQLKAAGIQVDTGILERECDTLIAPFRKLITQGLPWVHAKWAMTLDGKIATRTGHSQWISNEQSRAVVHRLRGRMDAILAGAATVEKDDPLLTARPAGPRTAMRLVVSRSARLPAESQLIRTSCDVPTAVTFQQGHDAPDIPDDIELISLPASGDGVDLEALLRELGRREMTNVLIEGGGELIGAFHDAGLIDELHVFIAPKLVGGATATSPIAGIGLAQIPKDSDLEDIVVQTVDNDVYLNGRVRHQR